MARINIFMKEDLLQAVDAEAAESHLSRSALIQSALNAFLEVRRQAREQEQRRREMEAASRGMDALAEKLGNWDPVGVIRGFRDTRALRVHEPKKRYRATRRKGRK